MTDLNNLSINADDLNMTDRTPVEAPKFVPPTNDFEDALNALEQEYEKSEPASQEVLEAGNYEFYLDNPQLDFTGKDEKRTLAVIIDFICLSAPYEGKKVRQWFRLNNEFSLGLWKELMKKCGQNPKTPLKALEPVLQNLQYNTVSGKLVNKEVKDRIFTNIYVQSKTGQYTPAVGA